MTQPVADTHDRAVRWRQLVDLLSRASGGEDKALVDAAFAMVRSEAGVVPREARAAAARHIAGRTEDWRLVALFASDELAIAAPVVSAAQLGDSEWRQVRAVATAGVAALIDRLTGGRAESPAEPAGTEAAEPIVSDRPSITEMVDRIERLRALRGSNRVAASWEYDEEEPEPRARPRPAASADLAEPEPEHETETPGPLPTVKPDRTEQLAEALTGMFRWECDVDGAIGWVDGAPRGALIGRSIRGEQARSGGITQAFEDRAPFDGAVLPIETPALEGEWRLSGIPAFSPVDGRFLGYRGIARRKLEGGEGATATVPFARDMDSLRETIHELKTPLNAIIGFAEIIDHQMFGPAHRNYRRRAAEIVSQARTLLAAIEDLDLAARLQVTARPIGPGVRLGGMLYDLAEPLEQRAAMHGVMLEILPARLNERCAISRDVADRMLKRFLFGVIDTAGESERLTVSASSGRDQCILSISRPRATAAASAEQLLDPAYSAETSTGGQGILGMGFALRVVRGLARVVGGDLIVGSEKLELRLPSLKR